MELKQELILNYTGYASTASQTNKDNKTSGTASANNYSDTAATYESSKGQTVSSATSKVNQSFF